MHKNFGHNKLSKMIHMILQQQKKNIEASGKIQYQEICEILDAFQIASGQDFAIGKTKALLEYLISGKSLEVENFDFLDKSRKISSVFELLKIYKDIDQSIDLSNDNYFKQYF